jgi:hypothetical protein
VFQSKGKTMKNVSRFRLCSFLADQLTFLKPLITDTLFMFAPIIEFNKSVKTPINYTIIELI